MRWSASDRVAVETLPFLAGPELPWSEWAMRPSAIALLVEEMVRGRRAVVELGSGVSTIVLARAAHELGARLVSSPRCATRAPAASSCWSSMAPLPPTHPTC
jgi:predicted O-methyltransferase YrrM